MKRRSLLVLNLFLTFSVLAEAPQSIEEGLREHFINTVKLDITLNQIQTLEAAGLSHHDIQGIVQSAEFANFLARVLGDEKILSQIDRQVSELMTPGYLESEIKKFKETLNETRREELVAALRELARYQSRPAKTLPLEEDGFLVKLWKQFKRDIFS